LGRREKVVMLELLRLGDDVPILIARHYMPADRFPDFAERFVRIHSITETFASYGVVGYRRGVTRLDARQPTSQEAAELGQSRAARFSFGEASMSIPRGARSTTIAACSQRHACRSSSTSTDRR
jgi:hypothetical protein